MVVFHLDQLYVPVSSAHKATHYDRTYTMSKTTLKSQINKFNTWALGEGISLPRPSNSIIAYEWNHTLKINKNLRSEVPSKSYLFICLKITGKVRDGV